MQKQILINDEFILAAKRIFSVESSKNDGGNMH